LDNIDEILRDLGCVTKDGNITKSLKLRKVVGKYQIPNSSYYSPCIDVTYENKTAKIIRGSSDVFQFTGNLYDLIPPMKWFGRLVDSVTIDGHEFSPDFVVDGDVIRNGQGIRIAAGTFRESAETSSMAANFYMGCNDSRGGAALPLLRGYRDFIYRLGFGTEPIVGFADLNEYVSRMSLDKAFKVSGALPTCDYLLNFSEMGSKMYSRLTEVKSNKQFKSEFIFSGKCTPSGSSGMNVPYVIFYPGPIQIAGTKLLQRAYQIQEYNINMAIGLFSTTPPFVKNGLNLLGNKKS
jgi:hypothetical protein